MKKVITYGTYDLLHQGHINLLRRAKALGDYLIVGVTSDDFDFARGKLNVQQSMAQRVAAVKATGLADEVIVEEYEGQKIDDIVKFGADIFTVGSDWQGKFDYLNEFCQVVYLPRTEGVSSTQLRSDRGALRLGIVAASYDNMTAKFVGETRFVNGIGISGVYLEKGGTAGELTLYQNMGTLLAESDAVYILCAPEHRAGYARMALEQGKHVLCESPVALSRQEAEGLFTLAREKNCVFLEAIKTAYAIAFNRLYLLVKSGVIGEVKAVEATCSSLTGQEEAAMGSLFAWGPIAMLPVFKLLGAQPVDLRFITAESAETGRDYFTCMQFVYPGAVASAKVGTGAKSEGSLVITGTRGYVYVPAPWWKTDYFEVRYENPGDNKRFFYQLPGEGIRYEISAFSRAIQSGNLHPAIDRGITLAIAGAMEQFGAGENVQKIQ